MKHTEEYEFEALTDDVCNSRQTIEKLLLEFDLNTVADNDIDRQNHASCIKNFHDAIAALRQIEILLEI